MRQLDGKGSGGGNNRPPEDFFETLVDMREYDVPYVHRVAIDLDLRVGAWYSVKAQGDAVELAWQKDLLEKVGRSVETGAVCITCRSACEV